MKNAYFDEVAGSSEQDLLQDLNVEAIQVHGEDMYYIPRTRNNPDRILGADDVSSFDAAYPIEMYLTSWEGFQGDQVFMSKFGLEIRDRVIFTVAKRTFQELVGLNAEISRPREGDLVYFPLNGKSFQIMFVDYKPFFYQLGDLQTYNLICELYEYSSETLNTGIPEIDSLQLTKSLNVLDWGVKDELGNYLTDENGDFLTLPGYDIQAIDTGAADNDAIETSGDDIIDFSEENPFSEKGY